MCCKNRRLTDHFPWQKEIAQGQAGASPGTVPAAVQEVTELGNLLVFRSLPGAEYWWAAPRARPALCSAISIKLQICILLVLPWPIRTYFVETTLHLHQFIWNQNQVWFWGRYLPPQVGNTIMPDRQSLSPAFHTHHTMSKAAENLTLGVHDLKYLESNYWI